MKKKNPNLTQAKSTPSLWLGHCRRRSCRCGEVATRRSLLPGYVSRNCNLISMEINPRTPSTDNDDEESLLMEIIKPVARVSRDMGTLLEESQDSQRDSYLFPMIFRPSPEAWLRLLPSQGSILGIVILPKMMLEFV